MQLVELFPRFWSVCGVQGDIISQAAPFVDLKVPGSVVVQLESLVRTYEPFSLLRVRPWQNTAPLSSGKPLGRLPGILHHYVYPLPLRVNE